MNTFNFQNTTKTDATSSIRITGPTVENNNYYQSSIIDMADWVHVITYHYFDQPK